MSDIEEVQQNQKTDNSISISGPASQSLSHMDSIEFHRFADMFDLSWDDRRDKETFDKLSFLYKWGGKQTNSNDRIEITNSLRRLTKGLGFTEKGMSQVKKLYQWARLDQNRRKIEEKQEALSG